MLTETLEALNISEADLHYASREISGGQLPSHNQAYGVRLICSDDIVSVAFDCEVFRSLQQNFYGAVYQWLVYRKTHVLLGEEFKFQILPFQAS